MLRLALVLLLCSAAARHAAGAVPPPEVAVGDSGVVIRVPQGQDVLVQYVDPTTGAPLGEPTRFATQADIVALQNLIAMKADTANVYSKTDVNNMLDGKADRTVVNDLVATKADADDVYSKDDVDYMLDNKADKSTVDSLASSKADASAVYTKTKVDEFLSGKVDTATVTNLAAAVGDKADASTVYDKTDVDNMLQAKADSSAVTTQLSTKADVSAVYTKSDVDAYFSTTVAVYSTGFQASTPKTGWSYLYNRNGPIGNANNYVPLVWNADTGTYATSATAYPNPDPLGAFATLTKTGGHPGRSDTQGVDHDIFVIAGYKVSKAGIYTIHKATLSQSPGGDGVEIRVYVNNQMRNLVDVDAYEEKGIPNIYDGDFDVYLGQLNVNDMIYVCVGPHGADSADGFAFDYTISMGLAPALVPNGYGQMPLLGLSRFATRSIHWVGTAANKAWQKITSGDEGRLETGMYVFYIPILQSSYDGGGQWLETISSSPFTWYAGGTNDADGSSNNIAFHKAGHADNVESFSFRTRRVPGGYLQLEFMVSGTTWSSPVELDFQFLRLM